MVKNNIEELKQRFLSQNFDIRDQALKNLMEIKGDSIEDFFIFNLKNEDRKIQISSAFALRSLAGNRSIKPLLEAIRHPYNRQHTGSFVYALQTHNCENLLIPIIEIALSNNYEAQTHALEILSRQKFKTSLKEIQEARNKIREYLNSGNMCDEYKVLIEELTEYLDVIESNQV